jgi:3D (Asp-Asp-Asp) domain-containing protein
MDQKREIAISIIYLLLFTALTTGFKSTINDRNRELKFQQEKNDLLLQDLQELREKHEILEEILLRDKHKIQKLEEEIEELKIIRARVTAYAPGENLSGICADGNPSVTATGTKPQHGTIAADFNKLEPGTKLEIPGYGIGVVEDTGAALNRGRGLRLDIYKATHQEAIEWGVKEIDVVLKR